MRMAQRTVLVCDLHDDEVAGDETVRFSLDRTSYEIDLCAEHAGQLREAFAPYVAQARRVGPAGAVGRRARSSARPRAGADGAGAAPGSPTAMRHWAREQGYEVADRGRLPGWMVDAYTAAH